jgi:hypothetical protein
MSHPILITGAAGGPQGSFNRRPTTKTYALWSAGTWPSKMPPSCRGVMARPSFPSLVQKTYPA